MNDETRDSGKNEPARSAPAARAARTQSGRPLPWFTADEIPLPPPEMREPPGAAKPRERGLFDEDGEE